MSIALAQPKRITLASTGRFCLAFTALLVLMLLVLVKVHAAFGKELSYEMLLPDHLGTWSAEDEDNRHRELSLAISEMLTSALTAPGAPPQFKILFAKVERFLEVSPDAPYGTSVLWPIRGFLSFSEKEQAAIYKRAVIDPLSQCVKRVGLTNEEIGRTSPRFENHIQNIYTGFGIIDATERPYLNSEIRDARASYLKNLVTFCKPLQYSIKKYLESEDHSNPDARNRLRDKLRSIASELEQYSRGVGSSEWASLQGTVGGLQKTVDALKLQIESQHQTFDLSCKDAAQIGPIDACKQRDQANAAITLIEDARGKLNALGNRAFDYSPMSVSEFLLYATMCVAAALALSFRAMGQFPELIERALAWLHLSS